MAGPAKAPRHAVPPSDITGRMAVFSRIFGEDVGVPDPSPIASSSELVRLVRSRAGRSTRPIGDSPIFEAAAFVGEWVRSRADARWISEGAYEPHLQVQDPSRAIVCLVPLVSVMRVASTAGYDGLPGILETVLGETWAPARGGPLDEIRVVPATDAGRVAAWVRAHGGDPGAPATLWRRCQTCASLLDASLVLTTVEGTWEEGATEAAAALAARPFECACGGLPDEVSRFLMLHDLAGDRKLADIYAAGSFTRIACWRVRGEVVAPFDAGVLAIEDAYA